MIHTEVSKCSSTSSSWCVAILNTGHVQQFLGDWSTDNTSTSGSWDQSDSYTATLTSDLKIKYITLYHKQRILKFSNCHFALVVLSVEFLPILNYCIPLFGSINVWLAGYSCLYYTCVQDPFVLTLVHYFDFVPKRISWWKVAHGNSWWLYIMSQRIVTLLQMINFLFYQSTIRINTATHHPIYFMMCISLSSFRGERDAEESMECVTPKYNAIKISRIHTIDQDKLTLHGTVCGFPILLPQ